MYKTVFSTAVLITACLFAGGCLSNRVSGNWRGACETSNGRTVKRFEMKLKQHLDNSISGTVVDMNGAEADVSGIIKKDVVELLVSDDESTPPAKFAGVLFDDTISGLWKAGGQTGIWAAKRK